MSAAWPKCMRVSAALAALAVGGPLSSLEAAHAPDWVNQAIASDDSSWQPESGAVLLYARDEVSYLPPGRPDSKGSAAGEHKVHLLQRGVVRIRTEEARRAGYAVLQYNPDLTHVISANAWVVGAQNQNVTAWRRKDFSDSVAVYNSLYWDLGRVLQLVTADKVGTGDALAWEFEYESGLSFDDWSSDLRWLIPMLRREYVVTPAPGQKLAFVTSHPRLLVPQRGAASGSLSWSLERFEALPQRLPSDFIANPLWVAVREVSTAPGSAPASWESVSSAVAREVETRVENPGAEVTAQVARDVDGKTRRWDRIRSLCRFVQESITYLQITEDHDSLAGWRPHSPAAVLRNRYGDCKDKATLLVSGLRSIGEEARVLLVDFGSPLAKRPDWPSGYFNHAIVVIKADGSEPDAWPRVATGDGRRWIVFDPTDQDVPLGVLPPGDGAGLGLIVAEKGGELVRLPVADPKASTATFRVHLNLGQDGVAQAKIAEDFQGATAAEAHRDRRVRSTEQYRGLLDDVVHRANPMSRDLHWKDNWDPNGARYHVDLDYSIPAFGHQMANGFLRVSPDVFSPMFRPPAWTEKADGTVFFSCDSVDEVAVLDLPDGYAVEELPDNLKRSGSRLSGEVTFAVQGSQITLTKRLTREAGFYDRAQYNELRAFYRDVHEAERAAVILRRQADKT